LSFTPDLLNPRPRPPEADIAVLTAFLENGPSYALEIWKSFGFKRYQTVSFAIKRLKKNSYVEFRPKTNLTGKGRKTVRLTKLGFMVAFATARRPPNLPRVIERNSHLITKRKHRTEMLLQLWKSDPLRFPYSLMVYSLRWRTKMEEDITDEMLADNLVLLTLTGPPRLAQTIENLRRTHPFAVSAFAKWKSRLNE
jgi:hypothetical protein